MTASTASRSHELTVVEVITETPDAVSLVLTAAHDARDQFTYQAGQFLTLRIPAHGGAVSRCYSLSSSPAADEHLGALGPQGLPIRTLAHGGDQVGHHHFAVGLGKALRPIHGLDIIVKMCRAFFKIGQILVGQVHIVALGVLLGFFDVTVANGIADAA